MTEDEKRTLLNMFADFWNNTNDDRIYPDRVEEFIEKTK